MECTNSEEKTGDNFSEHTQQDSALSSSRQLADAGAVHRRMSLFGKMLIFLLFPTLMGFAGLYIGYLETSRENADRELSFDQDFALPFALALGLALAIFLQTGGFSLMKPKPLISWPKVKKRKKVIHMHVVKGQGHGAETDQEAKKRD